MNTYISYNFADTNIYYVSYTLYPGYKHSLNLSTRQEYNGYGYSIVFDYR